MSKDNSIFIAVSSNYRDLYIADIYRVLAKPKHAIEHFRYQEKWIDDTESNDLFNPKKLINSTVILVFKDYRSSTYIPVRQAKIKHFEVDNDSQIFHYYFELLDFCDISNLDKLKEKDGKFLYKLDGIEVKVEIWKNVIEKIREYFIDKVFYRIDSLIDTNGKQVKLSYNKINQCYTYDLEQNREYTLNLTLANPNDSQTTLTIQSSTNDVNVILSDNYIITAPYDKIKVPILTKNIDAFKEKSYISFYLTNSEGVIFKEYDNHIHVQKKVSYIRSILFGLLSTMLVLLTWLLKDKTEDISNLWCWECLFSWTTIIYVLLLFFTSSSLLALYNKK